MKIAFCISGLQRKTDIDYSVLENGMFSAFKNINVDYYYQTWNKNTLINNNKVLVLDEPDIGYDCVADTKSNAGPWLDHKRLHKSSSKLYNSTKQILAHAFLVKSLRKKYDMIIKCRYDLYFSDKLDYNLYLEKSYEEGPYGFGWRSGKMDNESIKYLNSPEMLKKTTDNIRWNGMMRDPLIFHRPKHFNTDYVFYLHEKKELLPAEAGWYQILSKPYDDHHTNYFGGVLLAKDGKFK